MTASEERQLYLRMCNKGFAKTESWKPGFYFYSVNIPMFDDWALNDIALFNLGHSNSVFNRTVLEIWRSVKIQVMFIWLECTGKEKNEN